MTEQAQGLKFSDSVLVSAPPAQVWRVLSDARAMGPCIPGLDTVEIYEEGRSFGGKANIKVGSSGISFPTRVTWVEQEPPHRGAIQATATLAGFEIQGRGTITLAEEAVGNTFVVWEADVLIPDRLAGNALMVQMARTFATRFIQGFFQCLSERLASV